MEKKIKITNATQFENLIKELEKNPSLAKGFSRGSVPSNFKKMWEDISTKLNAFGPPTRDSDGWQKVWRDLKCKSKKKIAFNKAECNATGGGSYRQLQLSPLEEAVANLMKFQRQLAPDGLVCGVQDQGFSVLEGEEIHEASASALRSSNVECDEFLPTEESFAHHQPGASDQEWFMESIEDVENICVSEFPNTNNDRSKTPKKSQGKKKDARNSTDRLFELHNNMQDKVLNEISRTMTSIKNVLKDTKKIQAEKLELLRSQNENEKEIKKIKKEKLKLLLRKNEKEELFQNKMEIQKIELEIKKRELQKLNESPVIAM